MSIKKISMLLMLVPLFGNAIANGEVVQGSADPQSSPQAHIEEFKLSNGLRIIVQEDHRSPVVVSQVWYRAGSLDEVNGKTGVAHLLEHMMFKGTKKVKAGQFSRLIAAAGGRENAFTGADYTCYFQQLEKSQLPLSMKLEADRMANLQLTKEEFSKEIKVVMESAAGARKTSRNPR